MANQQVVAQLDNDYASQKAERFCVQHVSLFAISHNFIQWKWTLEFTCAHRN